MSALDVVLARVLLAVYLGLVALVVFQPAPDLAVGSVDIAQRILVRLGVPEVYVNAYRAEFVMNTLLFMPLPFLGMFAFPQIRWSEWVVVAFAGSAGIELTQALLLEGRSATFVDIVSNTLGALFGAVAGLVATGLSRLGAPARG